MMMMITGKKNMMKAPNWDNFLTLFYFTVEVSCVSGIMFCFKQLSKSLFQQQSMQPPFPRQHQFAFPFRCTMYGLGYEAENQCQKITKKNRITFPGCVAHELHIPVCNGIQRQLTVYSLAYSLQLSITASNVVVVVVTVVVVVVVVV